MDSSQYAFVHGVRATRSTLASWNRQPWQVLRTWLAGSFAAAALLLLAVWAIAALSPGKGGADLVPPIAIGVPSNVLQIFFKNLLVLGLHAMACVAGFIAGSSLPMQAEGRTGVSRWIHEHGGRFAILFVCAATTFSLCAQAYVLGTSVANVAGFLNCSPGLLLLGLLPHALPELMALFLPLAAWIIASRKGDWDKLLAATAVTVGIAVPVLVMTALWEVFVAPHVLSSLLHYHITYHSFRMN
jgi:Stage II sporulation protein M